MPSNLFKLATIRGIQHELVRNNAVRYPSKFAADAAVDAAAESPVAQAMPDESGPEGHSPQDIAALGQQLIQAGQQMMAMAHGSGGPGAAGPAPEHGIPAGPEAEAGAEAMKTSALRDFNTVAGETATELMNKLALEKEDIGKAENKNTPEQASKNEGVAALDLKQRGVNAYLDGVGHTAMDTKPGEVGKIAPNPVQPATSPSGTNSVNKMAELTLFLQKSAAKIDISKPENKNTPEQAAAAEGVAALDKKQRPANYALVGVGGANFKEPQAARIGMETPHPVGFANSPAGTNSVIQASKAAAEADLAALQRLHDKTAAEVAPYLPTNLNTDQLKFAAVNMMIGMTSPARAAFLKMAGNAKTAGELAEMLGMSPGTEEKKDDKKDEPKKEEGKKDEPKKEASLMDRVMQIAIEGQAK